MEIFSAQKRYFDPDMNLTLNSKWPGKHRVASFFVRQNAGAFGGEVDGNR